MEKLPSIALGTWSWGTGFAGGDRVFGNNLGVEELKPVFDEAMANGLNLWDSAVVYGMGVSETVLSTFTKNCKREDVFISTKFTPQIAGETIEASCQHIRYRVLRIASNLRCELGRDKHILPLAVLRKSSTSGSF